VCFKPTTGPLFETAVNNIVRGIGGEPGGVSMKFINFVTDHANKPVKKNNVMTEAEEYFRQLMKEVPDVKPGKMFGALCMFSPNGKSAAMFWKDNIVVKLQGNTLKEALNMEGTQQFEPMEGRPMKEWVQIPFKHRGVWKKYVMISISIVGAQKK